MIVLRSFGSFVLLMVFAVSLVVPSVANAELARGSIHIHSRVCNADAVQLFRDCHGNPGPAGAMYKIDRRVPKAIDAAGNVSFGQATAGDHLVTLTTGIPSTFERMRAFCSNSATGTGPNEATMLVSATPQFWVRVAPGSRLTCDVYFIP